jgi:uncharacterized protein
MRTSFDRRIVMDRAEPRVRNFGFSRRAWERIQFLVTSNGWPARLAQRFGGASAVHVESHAVRADGPPDAPPLRIAFASDFHAGPTTHPALLRAAYDALRAAEPDVLLLGGDFVCLDARYVNPLAEMLGEVPAPYGRFAVFGNHDLWTDYRHLERQLARSGVQLLTNRNVRLAEPFAHVSVCGLDDHMCGHPDGAAALQGADGVRIVLMHAPSGLLDLRGAEFDLAFSGHVHGGQIALPNGRPIVVPPGKLSRRFSHGAHRLWNGGTLIVSRGVGCSTVPFRANSPPEIVLCELRCEEASVTYDGNDVGAVAVR